ncbi:hypothetical protein ACHAXA_008815 [Cyclostephanos tholiformis]|uniref:Uncharacterized protein n=1 Tax=Cyclostephanos tholiformis TaxID=382380 RepID=A0ABD3RS37_9STRA
MDARSLRAQLDHLIERFRCDAVVGEGEGASEIVHEVRMALEYEYFSLTSSCEDDVLSRAVLLVHDDSMRLPIHLACDKNAPLSILRSLLVADTEKVSIGVPDKWGDLPLHTACSRHQTEVVKLLVDSDSSKRTLYVKADNGSLPLHSACRYQAPASVVMLLLESNESRRTLLESDVYGQLPLHAACRNGAHPDVIDLLLRYDEGKETVMREDHVGRLPIHLALLHSAEHQLEVVRTLLRGMFYNRMESRGLDLWKADMKCLLKSMTAPERDFATRDKLDMLCETVRDFMERAFALELVVWSKSCSNGSTSSMKDALDQNVQVRLADDTSSFDARSYRVDRRIKCGSDVIVRDVIPFLENDPVEETIRKIMGSYGPQLSN